MNVAIIGCGGMGRLHAQMARNCGLRVVACVDKDPAMAKRLAKAMDAHATHDVDGAIRRPDVDIVCITTPTPRHAATVTAAAAAGKHVFCEKPFARTMPQCRSALAAVKRAKVKLFVGHVVRYFHEFTVMKQEMEAGKIGAPGFAKFFRGGIYPGGPGSWFHDYTQSGGAVLDMMIHDFDWARYVWGEPELIFCRSLQRTTPENLDYAHVTMRMESGLIASFTGSWAHPAGFRVKVEICGDGGMLQFDSEDAPLACMMRQTAGSGPSMIVPGSPETVSPYQLQWEDFAAWIEKDRPPRVTPEDGVRAVEIALAALKSNETGKPVNL